MTVLLVQRVPQWAAHHAGRDGIDPQWRELTCDPKFRRVLITDGRTAVGQALAEACSAAGASVVFVGIADPWKPFPGEEKLRKLAPR